MKKLMKKLMSVVAAVAMVLTMAAVPAFAAGTGSITITPPTGTASTTTNNYKVYKVFDADGNGTNISYTLPEGKTLTTAMTNAGFSVDGAGNVTGPSELNAAAIAAIAEFVKDDTPVATPSSTGTDTAVASGLANGYYYITTSTGTAVTITSTNPNATVDDKNSVPSVDKTITSADDLDEAGKNALAQVGTTISYKSDITVPVSTKKLKFSDTLGSGLQLDTTSVKVQVNGADVATTNYTIATTTSSINISFNDSYLDTFTAATTITVTYDAKVTSDALTTTSEAGKNTASITYGDNDAKTTSSSTQTYNATISVTKTFEGTLGEGQKAEFVLKNSNNKYYAIADGVVSWVDTEDAATKLTFDAAKTLSFTGLSDGTYTLHESTVPAGYKAAADKNFTIAEKNYSSTNLSQSVEIENELGTSLPSTGGMGTTIFYVLGAALVIGAGVVLVTRRRLSR